MKLVKDDWRFLHCDKAEVQPDGQIASIGETKISVALSVTLSLNGLPAFGPEGPSLSGL